MRGAGTRRTRSRTSTSNRRSRRLPPAHDATYWLAVVGMVAGPLLVLWAVVFSGNPDPGWLIVAGLLMLGFGFGLLVMRGSGERDPDDDGSRL